MQRILVTGAAGFLGSNLVHDLVNSGNKIIGVDNFSSGHMRNLGELIENSNFELLRRDVVDLDWMDEIDGQLDVIVHLAAKKIPRYGGALDTLKTNYHGTLNVLELARTHGCKCVLASTSDVYGMNPELPFNEERSRLVMGSSKSARWSYAVSKLFDEHMALAYQEEYGFPVTLLRFFGAYGPRQQLSWLGGPPPVFIANVLNDETMPIHGDGLQTRSFTFVNDTVAGIAAACFSERANGEIINIGSDEEVTILELAHKIHTACGRSGEPKLEMIPYESFTGKLYEDVRRRVPDSSLCKELLGVEAKTTLDDGLALTVEWQRDVMGL